MRRFWYLVLVFGFGITFTNWRSFYWTPFFMIDIQIMLISLFPTPFDHFHFHGSGGLTLWYDLRLWHMHIIRSERLNTDSLWDSADQCNWNAEDFLVFHVFFAPIQFGHIPLVFATFRPFEQKTQTNLTLGATYRSQGRGWWWYLYIYDEFDDEN